MGLRFPGAMARQIIVRKSGVSSAELVANFLTTFHQKNAKFVTSEIVHGKGSLLTNLPITKLFLEKSLEAVKTFHFDIFEMKSSIFPFKITFHFEILVYLY